MNSLKDLSIYNQILQLRAAFLINKTLLHNRYVQFLSYVEAYLEHYQTSVKEILTKMAKG